VTELTDGINKLKDQIQNTAAGKSDEVTQALAQL